MIRLNSSETREQARTRVEKANRATAKKRAPKESIAETRIRKYGPESSIRLLGKEAVDGILARNESLASFVKTVYNYSI